MTNQWLTFSVMTWRRIKTLGFVMKESEAFSSLTDQIRTSCEPSCNHWVFYVLSDVLAAAETWCVQGQEGHEIWSVWPLRTSIRHFSRWHQHNTLPVSAAFRLQSVFNWYIWICHMYQCSGCFQSALEPEEQQQKCVCADRDIQCTRAARGLWFQILDLFREVDTVARWRLFYGTDVLEEMFTVYPSCSHWTWTDLQSVIICCCLKRSAHAPMLRTQLSYK